MQASVWTVCLDRAALALKKDYCGGVVDLLIAEPLRTWRPPPSDSASRPSTFRVLPYRSGD